MLRECILSVHCTRAARKENLTLTLTHTITAVLIKVEMSYVCAYSSVQLDKRRVEKEFTQLRRRTTSATSGSLKL